jgi:drug/metabolite transporter superfamily protein YnfA
MNARSPIAKVTVAAAVVGGIELRYRVLCAVRNALVRPHGELRQRRCVIATSRWVRGQGNQGVSRFEAPSLGWHSGWSTIYSSSAAGRIADAVSDTLALAPVVEGQRPDRWDLFGGGVCLVGMAIIVLGPRGCRHRGFTPCAMQASSHRTRSGDRSSSRGPRRTHRATTRMRTEPPTPMRLERPARRATGRGPNCSAEPSASTSKPAPGTAAACACSPSSPSPTTLPASSDTSASPPSPRVGPRHAIPLTGRAASCDDDTTSTPQRPDSWDCSRKIERRQRGADSLNHGFGRTTTQVPRPQGTPSHPTVIESHHGSPAAYPVGLGEVALPFECPTRPA